MLVVKQGLFSAKFPPKLICRFAELADFNIRNYRGDIDHASMNTLRSCEYEHFKITERCAYFAEYFDHTCWPALTFLP